ncbi:MAG: GvpL/GvpF family gas vesicle protein [Candidatus Atribacteria bacterium]|nr:GvpL/GvpF family gas vesicle protein [Candidatus Atribacteria bacterium]
MGKVTGKYIYCIIGSGRPRSFGPLGIGDKGGELTTICFDGVAAVVSDSPIMKYRLSRDNMIAHEKAIEEVMKEHQVLPVRFCTIAESEEKIMKILEKEHDRFVELLKAIAGKTELSVIAIFKEDVIYKDITEKYQDIRAFKERIAGLPPEKTRGPLMEIGRRVEAALHQEREIHKEEILQALTALSCDVKVNDNYGELMILKAAFLVERRREEEFDRTVNDLAEKYAGQIRFKYVGTLPPFNFVNLVIETGNY